MTYITALVSVRLQSAEKISCFSVHMTVDGKQLAAQKTGE